MKRHIATLLGAFLLLLSSASVLSGASLEEENELETLVEQAALEAVADQISPPDRLEVVSYRFGGADPVPEGTIRLELLEASGPNAAGFVRLRFRVLVDGLPRGEARATVRGEIHGPALVATRTLTRAEPIDARAVMVTDVDLTRLTGEPLRDPARALGLVPVRTLGAKRVLTTELLQPAPVVRKGDPVELKIEHRRMTVVARGRVLRDGAPGETVPAENTATGTRLLARVQADGTLIVLGGAGGRR